MTDNKLVVLKQQLPAFAEDATSRRSFREEAKLSARLNHPHVVQTYEVGRHGDHDVIVMEYLEGQALSSVITRSYVGEPPRLSLPLSLHLRIVADALAGLHYAHELADYDGSPLNLVHRDISPHNIFLTYDGQVKLLDFGIAKAAISSMQTEEGVLKGRIGYMAPEQVLGEQLDRRSDLVAMGAILWEAAAGARLWKDVAEVVVLQRVANGAIPSPRTVNPDVDPELERIVMKAVAADRELRYATAEELQLDIESFLQKRGCNDGARAIGRLVSSLFQEERRAMKATISAKLVALAGSSAAERETVPELVARLPAPSSVPTSSGHSLTGRRSLHAGEGASRLPWAAGAALFAIAGLLAWWRLGDRPQLAPPQASVAAPPPSEPQPAAAAPAPTIECRISVLPAEARLFLDEQPVPNPIDRTFPADVQTHKIRAEARGYETRVVDVTFAEPVSLDITLEKALGAPVPPRARPAKPVKATPATSAVSQANGSRCDQPFYIDGRGIKTLRPECR